MHHTILETNRLMLTGFTPGDMQFIFDNLTKPEIKKLLGHHSDADYLREERKQRNGYSSYNRTFLLFLLKYKASGRIIGRCGLHNWNKDHNRAEIGYVMEDESFRQKGLMNEAVKSILHYGFQHLNLNRIEALVGAGNIPSIKIVEKNNFKPEGILKQHMHVGGNYIDTVMYALLRSAYELNTQSGNSQ